MLLEGLHIPLTTPFHADGRVNLPKLAANVARYSLTPAASLIVLGPSGEPTLLSDEETREVLRTVAQSTAPEKVLIAGISRDSVRATLELAEFAAGQGYDAVLIAPPSFLAPEAGIARPDENRKPIPLSKNWLVELQTYFQTVADRSPLPIILLNIPSRILTIAQAREASSHTNVIGLLGAGNLLEVQNAFISSMLQETSTLQRQVVVTPVFAAVTSRMKAAAANGAAAGLLPASSLPATAAVVAEPTHPQSALRTRTKSVGFQIIAAHTPRLLDALEAGAVGIAPAFAACAPQACYEVYAAWKENDEPLAREKQERLMGAAYLTEHELGPGGLKFACDLNGYFGGLPRLPHLPPTGEQLAALEVAMKDLRN